ncbi:j domain-containing protein [Caerostris extrusa]|uniref:J domain-containing protein n=1 Tax=Caerostris extrusa TaxID=172846 RepID=A0AAV4NFL6_CAEEX|nr:j domain-containing protein [Caerostris extrusa]
MPNLYEILNVDPFDSESNISEAADKLIAEWDPDPFDDRKARAVVAAVMREIIDARNILTDPQKRQEYDVRIGLADVVYKDYELGEELPVSAAGNVKMMSYLDNKRPCHKVGKEHSNQHHNNHTSGPILQNTIISFSSDFEPLTSSQSSCETWKNQERPARKFSKPVIKVSQIVNGVEKVTRPETMRPEEMTHQYSKEIQPIIPTEYHPISKKEILKRTKEIESVIEEDISIKTDTKITMPLKHSKSIQMKPEMIIGEESHAQISKDETQKEGKILKDKSSTISSSEYSPEIEVSKISDEITPKISKNF